MMRWPLFLGSVLLSLGFTMLDSLHVLGDTRICSLLTSIGDKPLTNKGMPSV